MRFEGVVEGIRISLHSGYPSLRPLKTLRMGSREGLSSIIHTKVKT
ncbi:hypothetical protein IC006_0437 [Sulfuracidifex tepidarius]|uniref:Uncharacterized protein n=1 Tax=Sulfuracidifex tepidarius TaxID=1294262 RepID=A0A510DSJ9_9CREN|nr:hypothetical protein IC006_0437 [Sulfuracidifex tepidarius]